MSVAQSCVTTRWFMHKELAFALGLNLAVPRVGSVLNAIVSPAIALAWNRRFNDGQGVVAASWVGFGMCALSLLSACVLVFYVGTEPPANDQEDLQSLNERTRLLPENQTYPPIGGKQFDDRPASLLQDIKLFVKSSIRTFRSFPVEFWLLCLIVMLVYGTIIPFNATISEFLQTRYYQNDPQTAGQVMGIPDTICAFLVSLCGYAIDRYGRRGSALVVCCLAIALVHLTLALVPVSSVGTFVVPILPLCALGIAYSVYGVAFWSAIACVFGIADDHEEIVGSPTSSTLPYEVSIGSSPQTWIAQSPAMRRLTLTNSNSNLPQSPVLSRRLTLTRSSSHRLSTTSLPLLAAARVIPPITAATFRPPGTKALDRNTSFVSVEHQPPSPIFATVYSSQQGSQESLPQLTGSLQQVLPPETHEIKDEENHLAVAYGLSTSAMNLSLTFVPLITAAIRDHYTSTHPRDDKSDTSCIGEFVPVELFFVAEATLAALIGVVIVYLDYSKHNGQRLERVCMK